MTEPKASNVQPRPRRRGQPPSLFGPILLIAVGVYFLLENLGVVTSLNWAAALQLWPLLLVFIGLNIIVRQAPRPMATLLSLLLAIVAVGAFGYVLLAEDNAVLNRLGISGSEVLKRESVEYASDAENADVVLDFNTAGASVYALMDSTNLIEGEVSYTGRLIFDADTSGNVANVRLDTEGTSTFLFFPAMASWGSRDAWQIGLSPNVTLDLDADVGTGSVDLDLADLTLSALRVEGGTGRTEVSLPAGDYDAFFNIGTGSWTISLPAGGSHEFTIDGGTGSLTLELPDGMEARVVLDTGTGSFNASNRLTMTEERDDREIWETEDFARAGNRVELIIEQGTGSIRIERP